jgi:hemoglobin
MSQNERVGSKDYKDTVYDRVGGLRFFTELVDKFYELIETDSLLRPMYPEDLNPGKKHLAGFLSQYWGGAIDYTLLRGHPRLRMRHSPFNIGKMERDKWVTHMLSALDGIEISIDDKLILKEYFESTATLLINNGSA